MIRILRHCTAKLLAVAFFCSMMTNALSAYAETTENAKVTVTVEKSEYLSDVASDEDITGRIVVTVRDYPVHAIISRYSNNEPPAVYYDMELTPSENAAVTEYVFQVNCCEYAKDPSTYKETYTSSELSGSYGAVYYVSLQSPDEDSTPYVDKSVLIADQHYEAITNSTYTYDVSFAEKLEDDAAVKVSTAVSAVTDSNWNVSRTVQFAYKPYTLGDTDDDGKIDSSDVFNLAYYAACDAVSMELPTNVNPDACDIDQNGKVDSVDLLDLVIYCAYNGAAIPITFEQIISGEYEKAS